MTTLLVEDDTFLDHQVPEGHPERPARLRAVRQALAGEAFAGLRREPAVAAADDALLAVHPRDYVDGIRAASMMGDLAALDMDTFVSRASFDVASRAAGGACRAVDEIMAGNADNAFVAGRPPGHHAERDRAMGFCLFGTAVVAARHAQRHGADRVAIVDWDVHHGNGTQALVWDDPTIFYASTHQMPHYPGTGAPSETGVGNILNVPLRAGDGSEAFRRAFGGELLPAVTAFAPDFVIVSAGFDAHRRDPLGNINLEAADFAWATREVVAATGASAAGRIVSVLEGGYDLQGLADSTAAHVAALMAA